MIVEYLDIVINDNDGGYDNDFGIRNDDKYNG